MLGGQVEVARIKSEELSRFVPALWRLFDDAFEGDFTTADFENALGGQHFIRFVGERVVAHGAVVERSVSIDEALWRIGYVEAIAVASDFQGLGLGRQILEEVTDYCRQEFSLALLSTDEMRFYERFGWKRFTGETLSQTESGLVRTLQDDGTLMFLSSDPSIRLAKRIVALDRSKHPW